jgi:PDDEXK-like domain of unknown function (DUF3799)
MQITPWNGKPITRAGWYSGVPIEKYHSPGICKGKAVSSTDLRMCWGKSPAHMFAGWAENPKREPRKATTGMILGGVAHHLLLGEDDFQTKYVRQPLTYRDKKTREQKSWHNGAQYCQAWHEEQRQAGKVAVTNEQFNTILQIAASINASAPLKDAMRGYVEISGFWKDEQTGLWLKVRPDVVPTDDGFFVDLKTAAEVTTPAVQSAIRSRGYHQQAALIVEATQVLEHPFDSFYLLFAETAQPYCVRGVQIDEDDLARGYAQNRAMLRQINDCIVEDIWPGPGFGDVDKLPLAIDERRRIDERLKREGVA